MGFVYLHLYSDQYININTDLYIELKIRYFKTMSPFKVTLGLYFGRGLYLTSVPLHSGNLIPSLILF